MQLLPTDLFLIDQRALCLHDATLVMLFHGLLLLNHDQL